MIPPPPVPPWITRVAAVAWLALVTVSAVVGGYKGFVPRWTGMLLDTAATVAFAAAGLGLITERWQRREWKRRTGPVVRLLLDRTCDRLCELATLLYDVPVRALPELQRLAVDPIESAFRLPFVFRREERLLRGMELTREVATALWFAADLASGCTREKAQENQDRFTPRLSFLDSFRPSFDIEPDSLQASGAIHQYNRRAIAEAFERVEHVIAELIPYAPDSAVDLAAQIESLRNMAGEPIDDETIADDTASIAYREAREAITLVGKSDEGLRQIYSLLKTLDSIYRTRADEESALGKLFDTRLDSSEDLQEAVRAQAILPTIQQLESLEKFFPTARAASDAGERTQPLEQPGLDTPAAGDTR